MSRSIGDRVAIGCHRRCACRKAATITSGSPGCGDLSTTPGQDSLQAYRPARWRPGCVMGRPDSPDRADDI